MTRNELLKKLCAAEGGKREVLDAGQCREVLAKLRQIIGEEVGIDLDDILAWRCVGMSTDAGDRYEAFRVYGWHGGKPSKPKKKI